MYIVIGKCLGWGNVEPRYTYLQGGIDYMNALIHK